MISGTDTERASPVIELVELHKVYRVGTELVHALRGTTMTVRENEYVAIMGASGSGKSTMLNILGCLDVPTEGEYRLRGQDVSKLSQTKLARIRGRQIGFVFYLVLATDVITTEAINIVHGIDYYGSEAVVSGSDLAAGGQKLFPCRNRHLVNVERIETGLCCQK